MTLPQPEELTGLPRQVTIYEVSPRDGLQNEQTTLPVEVKLELLDRLVDSGLRVIEATSFVHPQRIPQLADADAVMRRLNRADGVRYSALVPNERGLERAIDLGMTEIAIFGSATESFARRNLNRTLHESLGMFAPVVSRAKEKGMRVRGYLSMCFGDPWEGQVSIEQVVRSGCQLLDLGCDELSIGDTIGTGTPGHVAAVLTAFVRSGVAIDRIAVHFHDTYGQALANTLVALQHGVTIIDASAGGVGGCPYAVSATGNLATEDLVWMLQGLGIRCGVDLPALVETSQWLADRLGRVSPSRVVRALSH